jgi:hypothetical protein
LASRSVSRLSCRFSFAISCSSFFVEGIGCRAIQASRLFTSAVRSARKSSVKSVAMTVPSTASSMIRADL